MRVTNYPPCGLKSVLKFMKPTTCQPSIVLWREPVMKSARLTRCAVKRGTFGFAQGRLFDSGSVRQADVAFAQDDTTGLVHLLQRGKLPELLTALRRRPPATLRR